MTDEVRTPTQAIPVLEVIGKGGKELYTAGQTYNRRVEDLMISNYFGSIAGIRIFTDINNLEIVQERNVRHWLVRDNEDLFRQTTAFLILAPKTASNKGMADNHNGDIDGPFFNKYDKVVNDRFGRY